MKFIHTADIHWGMNPDHDKPWSRDRAQAIKDTFSKIVRQAKLRDVDFLFIAASRCCGILRRSIISFPRSPASGWF